MKVDIGTKKYSVKLSMADVALIYDALNDYPQWNDDEDDNPTSVIMGKLYDLLEFYGDDSEEVSNEVR